MPFFTYANNTSGIATDTTVPTYASSTTTGIITIGPTSVLMASMVFDSLIINDRCGVKKDTKSIYDIGL
jgi:hypothetical protein